MGGDAALTSVCFCVQQLLLQRANKLTMIKHNNIIKIKQNRQEQTNYSSLTTVGACKEDGEDSNNSASFEPQTFVAGGR
jgi:hypothetical protein